MLRKALITLLMLGSSTVALARPAPGNHREPVRSSAVVRNHGELARSNPVMRDRREPVEREFVRREPVRREVVRREPVRTPYVRDHREERPVIRTFDRDWSYRSPTVVYRQPSPRYIYEQTPIVYESAPVVVSAFAGGQMYIALGGAAGNGIELVSNGGQTYVAQVAVQYTSGRTQLIDVSQYVDGNNPTLDLAIDDSCPIAGVTVYGSGTGVTAVAI